MSSIFPLPARVVHDYRPKAEDEMALTAGREIKVKYILTLGDFN